MLILLPVLVFAALFLGLLGRGSAGSNRVPWQSAFLLASALWGAALVVITEGLSLFTAIGSPGVVAGWTLVLLGSLVWGHSRGYLAPGWVRLRSLAADLNKFEIALLAVVGAMAFVLLAVVFAAPVNTVDVLQYHMPRVLQWAQNASLDHFPTPHGHQNKRPYWAEGVMLHLRLLWGGDTPVELVNWFAWLALAVPASGTALLLGADRRQAWLAAVFTWTIPTAVLHATTGMSDLPAAYWAAVLGYFVLTSLLGQHVGTSNLGLGGSFGLGMLTKGTFFPFAAGLLAVWGLMMIGRQQWRPIIISGAVAAIIAASLNAGFWSRNVATYGGPYGGPIPAPALNELISKEGTDLFADAELDRSGLPGQASVVPMRGVRSAVPMTAQSVANAGWTQGLLEAVIEQVKMLIRMASLHLLTPVGVLNEVVFQWMAGAPGVFPLGYVQSMRLGAWNNVMNGGSPVHFLLGIVSILLAVFHLKRRPRGSLLVAGWALALLLGYGLLSLLSTADSPFGVRYQLPLLVLSASLVACTFPMTRNWLVALAAVGFFVYASPYVLLNQTRPVVGRTPWPTKIDSVFITDDREVLFVQSPEIADEYVLITREVGASSCQHAGLKTDAKDLEYSLWWLLEAGQSGLQIEHLAYPEFLRRTREREFTPCAVICTVCSKEEGISGLPLTIDAGHIRLYSEP